MSDLETRLRDTLAERAGAAPDAGGLALGARRRLRRRRTTRALVAAAVVAAAVPVGLGLGGGDPAPDTSPVASEPPPVADGFRAETWRDLTFEVPEEWGQGGSDWCVTGETYEQVGPRVARPDTVSFRIGCSPSNGYGVVVQSTASFDSAYGSGAVWRYQTEGVEQPWYPDDAWLGVWIGSDWALTVATPDRAVTERIVASARSFTGLDPNGCPATLGEAEALTSTEQQLTLCRYDDQDLLAASRSWIGADADAARATLDEAPDSSVDATCNDGASPRRIIVLDEQGYVATAVLDGCRRGIGIYFPDGTRKITDGTRQLLASIG
jgi:hypothetical protein